jgi:carboxymethylenebutenolidase
MELKARWVTHQRDGQSMTGFLVSPAAVSDPLPAVVVIQEIWGPDDHIQDVAKRFAAAGYTALAPDLYSRGQRPEALQPARIDEMKRFMEEVPSEAWHNQDQMQAMLRQQGERGTRIGETMGALFGPKDTEGMVKDLAAWLDYLEAAPESRGRPVGTTGYCMGGALSFLLATRDARPRVALVYYGTAPDAAAMAAIRCPVHGFYGGTDTRITERVPEVEAAMQAHGKSYSAKIYASAGHAFFNDTRKSYHVDAARDAWAVTLSLFNQHLGQ